MIEFLPQNLHQLDLHLIQYGMEQCSGGHSFGPAVREYYKIHYILDGEGIFEIAGKTYRLGKGQGFLICPGTVTYYKADEENPWRYCWIGFNGIKAATLLKQANLWDEQPLFNSGPDDDFYKHCIDMMIESSAMKNGREIKLTGLLYIWLSTLVQYCPALQTETANGNSREKYIAQVVHFIELNYANKITVTSIAHFIGLQRSYLSSLFREVMNTSIQDYLISYRMRKACELLQNSNLSIGDIARSVGYDDPLLFSKMFKKTINTTPTQYRSSSVVH
ncbi:AraC family transcriptional regulator [Cohnella sp. WQ 127256]|uniref:AraC family transcriptional regulator n=1 Tax=Cohnella sp. WQ 127256 TaxID=2938790 RepID=UPI002119A329|nr:AraC family transcriptional regulator [Cohnella sp. WQ 127256]